MKAMQSRDKRALLLLGIAVGLYVVIAWVALPAWDALTGAQAAATEKETLLEKYRQVAGRKGRYDVLLERAAKQREEAGARLIQAASPSLASAEFQTLIEGVAQKAGVTLGQRNVIVPGSAAPDGLREVTMSVSFEGTPQQMVGFLSETRALAKAVRVLTLTVAPLQTAQEAPKNSPFSKNIRVSATLGAWMQDSGKAGN